MKNERQKASIGETVKNAASGYAVIVLASICLILAFAALSTLVRIIVGAGAGA